MSIKDNILKDGYVDTQFEKAYMDSPLGAINIRCDETTKRIMKCAFKAGWIASAQTHLDMLNEFSATKAKGE